MGSILQEPNQMRAHLLVVYQSLFCKLGEIFETFIFYLSKFDKIVRYKIRYVYGIHCPKSQISLCKASLTSLSNTPNWKACF